MTDIMTGITNLEQLALADPGTVLKPAEVARLFRVSTRSVSHWVDIGKLPSFRTPGGHHRFTAQAVLEAAKLNEAREP